jgi:dephospho-CoA kinase
MLKVGLTGNIGSGKTIVAQVFKTLGIPVFHADVEARKLYDLSSIRHQVRNIFGDEVFSPSGEILKTKLAEIVFNDRQRLEDLNRIIHPAVRQEYRSWLLQHENKAYTLYEAAILFESGHYLEMDKVICVTAPEDLRIRRVMERDNITSTEVKNRIANQWPEEKKIELSDFVIENDGDKGLIEQVLEVHKKIIGREDGKTGRL